MKLYIYRDIYSGRIYKTLAHTARDAKVKVARAKGVDARNLAHVRPQEAHLTH